jgi:hypothetical protein
LGAAGLLSELLLLLQLLGACTESQGLGAEGTVTAVASTSAAAQLPLLHVLLLLLLLSIAAPLMPPAEPFASLAAAGAEAGGMGSTSTPVDCCASKSSMSGASSVA